MKIGAIHLIGPVGLLLFLPPVSPVSGADPVRLATEPELSARARKIIERSRKKWFKSESEHFTLYAPTVEILEAEEPKAAWAYAGSGSVLGLNQAKVRGRIVILNNRRLWKRRLVREGHRPDMLALHADHEIFLLRDTNSTTGFHDLFHEMIHYRLDTSDTHLPLWMEEGLAIHLGWEHAKAYYAGQGRTLFRELPPLDAPWWWSMSDLDAAAEYPQEAEAARAFYRMASEYVRGLILWLGRSRIKALVQAVGEEDVSCRRALEQNFGWSQGDFEQLEALVRSRIRNEWKE